MSPEDRIVRIRVSRDIIEHLWVRTNTGAAITVEWGEPDAEGFHNPVFTAVDDGHVLITREMLADAMRGARVADRNNNEIGVIEDFAESAATWLFEALRWRR